MISEKWSSDCCRDVPILARLAEAGGLEMRVLVLWASAAVDEILSALHERLVVGAAG